MNKQRALHILLLMSCVSFSMYGTENQPLDPNQPVSSPFPSATWIPDTYAYDNAQMMQSQSSFELYRLLEEDLRDETSGWMWKAKQWMWSGTKVVVGAAAVIIAITILLNCREYLCGRIDAMRARVGNNDSYFIETFGRWYQINNSTK